MKKIVHVDAAGTYTFYVNGIEVHGTDSAELYFAYADATFIPDSGT